MDMMIRIRKDNQIKGFFRVCDIVQIVEKTPTIEITKIGDNKRVSTSVEASKKEIDINRNIE